KKAASGRFFYGCGELSLACQIKVAFFYRVRGLTAVTIMLAEGSAAHLASAVAENVQYHVRKVIRRRSEARRQAILDAAMRIIIREGVRAVRHRAVAAEAEVPLSATTYYFKDISDLITDTFALYVERSAARL